MKDFSGWSLFLDRDGVLNQRIVGGYVTRPEDFIIIDGVLDAMRTFTQVFSHIFIVTNQQGIGKGLMTEEDLSLVHSTFVKEVEAHGGRIDKIYYCPKLKSEHSFDRKPRIGMALKARKDFPDVRFRQSVMIGDSKTDMEFGKHAGMTTVLVGDEPQIARQNPRLVDYCYPTLFDFCRELKSEK